MSIIQEALKKTQSYIENQKPSKVEGPKTFKAMPSLLAVLIVLSIAFVSQFLSQAKFPAEGGSVIHRIKLGLGGKSDHSVKTDFESPTAHQETTYRPTVSKQVELRARSNPATHLEESDEIKPQLVLNGIMHLNDGPQAIINNSTVSEGDTVGGAKVMRINKNNVVLNFNDLEITLSLKK